MRVPVFHLTAILLGSLAVVAVPDSIPPGALVEVRASWSPPPGKVWPVEVVVRVDDDGAGVGTEEECDENNNESEPVTVSCD